MIYLIIFIIFFLFNLTYGLYSFVKHRKEKRYREILFKTHLFMIIPLTLDILSTSVFFSKLGHNVEGNLLGRFLLGEFSYLALPIMFIFALFKSSSV